MPAEAGIHLRYCCKAKTAWIPVSAGMADGEVEFQSINF